MSALEFGGQRCEANAEVLGRCLGRAAERAAEHLGPEHAVTAWLDARKNQIGDYTVLSIELELPNPEDRLALADILDLTTGDDVGAGFLGGLLDGESEDEAPSSDWAGDDLRRFTALLR